MNSMSGILYVNISSIKVALSYIYSCIASTGVIQAADAAASAAAIAL